MLSAGEFFESSNPGKYMKILVCIKQVPDAESNPVIDGDSHWIKEEKIAFRMNRYDEYALEEALIIKDNHPGTIIDVLTVGPDRAAAVIRKGLEKGADHGIHIINHDPALQGSATSSLIADFATGKNYDLVFAGVMSEDAMQCQVGPMIASHLSIPCAVSVVRSAIDPDERSVTAECELEGGFIETVKLFMPCLITVQTGVNQPRYPSLSNVMRARGMQHEILFLDTIYSGSAEYSRSLFYPESEVKGKKLEGTSEEKAAVLIELLHERGLL